MDDICVADVENCADDPVEADIDVDAEFLCGVCEERYQDLINHAPEVSVVGSPLFTDDDRRLGPADHDQQLQGGSEKSKHFEVLVDKTTENVYDANVPPMGHISAFRAELLSEAKSRFAQFLGIEVSVVREE